MLPSAGSSPTILRRAIVSGFLERDTPAAPGWRRLDRRTLDGWAAELLEREEG